MTLRCTKKGARAPRHQLSLRPLGTFVVGKIEAELASKGLPADCSDDSIQIFQVAKTASRSVLGFMNEMAFYLEYAVAEAGGLGSSDVSELNRDVRRRLHSRDGYATPLELVARLPATAK